MVIPHMLAAWLNQLTDPISTCVTGGAVMPAANGDSMRYFDANGNFYNGCGADIYCDIIIVGGGGGGGSGSSGAGDPKLGGGGGAGGYIFATNIKVVAGETIPVHVGAGGAVDTNGGNSIVWLDTDGTALDPLSDPAPTAYKAVGGGYGGSGGGNGNTGGSGGGGGSGSDISVGGGAGGSATGAPVTGNAGAAGVGFGGSVSCNEGAAGGGGSAGAAGVAGASGAPPIGGMGGPAVLMADWGFIVGAGGSGAAILQYYAGSTPCAEISVIGDPGTGFGYGGGGGIDGTGGTAGRGGIVAFMITGVGSTEDWPSATIARDSTGLVFRDQFTTSNGNLNGYNGWSTTTAAELQVSSNKVVSSHTYGVWEYAVQNLGDQGHPIMVQVNCKRNSGSFGGEVMCDADGKSYNRGYVGAIGYQWNNYNILKRGVLKSNASTVPSSGQWDCLRFSTQVASNGTEFQVLSAENITDNEDLSNDVTLRDSWIDAGTLDNSGYYGFVDWNGDMEWDEFFVCGVSITVEGVPAGWTCQIDSRTAKNGGADIAFDPTTWALPATSIKVYDPDSVLVYTLTPSGGIWGGDAFSVTIATGDPAA